VHPAANQLTFESLEEGMVLRGRVTRLETFGIFINLHGSALTGLCHKSRISDTFVNDISAHYSVGDNVKCLVEKLNKEKKQVTLNNAARVPSPRCA
jgi:rRNA biogenesis protein RRP5